MLGWGKAIKVEVFIGHLADERCFEFCNRHLVQVLLTMLSRPYYNHSKIATTSQKS